MSHKLFCDKCGKEEITIEGGKYKFELDGNVIFTHSAFLEKDYCRECVKKIVMEGKE